ncbi:hypothetical protein AVEN_182632-1 [Araneus ventricosus]|uniref:Uncharacterized protein n=1 Tax=Araneus ventricosus TaxID=182803 RepID=A0A4Y2KCB6_ARAVE|nr:hypothetical protein AVEN_182632-1 [Araneus ventricosus]
MGLNQVEVTYDIKFTHLGKANTLLYSLEISFQTNAEPYDNSNIVNANKAIKIFINFPNQHSNVKLTSPQEIIYLLKKANPKKAIITDGIPNKAFQLISSNVITYNTKVFNKCLMHNYFLTDWKTAHVLMFRNPAENHKIPGNC